MEDKRFESEVSNGYLDYSARLSINEVKELNLERAERKKEKDKDIIITEY